MASKDIRPASPAALDTQTVGRCHIIKERRARLTLAEPGASHHAIRTKSVRKPGCAEHSRQIEYAEQGSALPERGFSLFGTNSRLPRPKLLAKTLIRPSRQARQKRTFLVGFRETRKRFLLPNSPALGIVA